MKKKVRVVVCDHQDLTWRRAYRRDLEFHGQNFVSYSKIEEYYILELLQMARTYPDYRFTIESPEVLRNFLDRNPSYEEELRQLYANGRIHTTFTGNNIVDSNLCSGESIIRNFLHGKRWMQKHMNQSSEVCMRTDAFGNSAQLPQIVRGFGCKYIGDISYTFCKGNYWRGLDGSVVATHPFDIIFTSGGHYKYPPCPKCRGYGCEACHGRGIDEAHVLRQVTTMDRMELSCITGNPLEYIRYGGEEVLPRGDLPRFIKDHKDELEVVYSSFEDLYHEIDLSQVDCPPEEEVDPRVEMNPNNTGTYATRIHMKQRLRSCENALYTAEVLDSLHTLATGENRNEQLEKIWRKLEFTMFHDALPATHVDASYQELMDTFDEIEADISASNEDAKKIFASPKDGILSVLNPTANEVECETVLNGKTALLQLKPYEIRELSDPPAAKPVSVRTVGTIASQRAVAILTNETQEPTADAVSEDTVIENSRYRIVSGLHGIREIFDKKLGFVLAKEEEYCPFGFVMEHDEGSPWATLSDDLRRISLKSDTILTEVETCGDYQKLIYRVSVSRHIAYSIEGLAISYDVTLYKNSDKIYVHCSIKWDTYNYRLRMAVPLTITGEDTYEIPYGWLSRPEYGVSRFSGQYDDWATSMTDYPAINWAGVQSESCGVYLFNQGTPSHSITKNQNGGRTIFVTPLRSPTYPTYLHETTAYSMTDWDGMRDAGNHEFSFMLEAFAGNHTRNQAILAGAGFNSSLFITEGAFHVPALPTVSGTDVRITAIKRAEDEDALIVRLVELSGTHSICTMQLPDWVSGICLTDLNEQTMEELNQNAQTAPIRFHPFEIKTVKLTIRRKGV